MTGGLIGGDQTAESDIVARGVLDARQDAFASQLDEQIAAELDAVEADRYVIGEQRNVNGCGDGAEVIGDLDGIVDRVEGAGGHDGVHSQGLGAPGLLDDTVRRRVDRSGKDGHAPCRRSDGALDDGIALSVGEIGRLTGGAQEEQSVDSSCDEVLDDAVKTSEVNRAVLGEWRDNRGDEAGETGVHVLLSLISSVVREWMPGMGVRGSALDQSSISPRGARALRRAECACTPAGGC